MARNTAFESGKEPMATHDSLQLDEARVHGPFSFLNPTQARYHHINDADTRQPSNLGFRWTSRNNRKGRHALIVKPPVDNASPDTNYTTPRPSTHWRSIAEVCWRMLVYYPVFDISWDVAYIFVWGSVVWVINAFFSFLPDVAPSTEFNNEILVGGGVTAFIGATIFEVGSILLMLEAINENRSSCFGWATRQLLSSHKHGETEYEKGDAFSDKGLELAMVPDAQHCSHHHRNSKNLVGSAQASSLDHMNVKTQHAREKSWSWWPSSYDLRTHYLHDLGFIACSWQLFGASIFWISGFTALPGINNKLSAAALNGAYWFPQVLGGFGFIVSGVLFMIETQKHWWQPAPRVLGWHIGLWNLIGGVGFTLCPAFGFDTSSWAQYQAGCSTFWGSWAFLIGSLIQLYESLEKNPVELDRSST